MPDPDFANWDRYWHRGAAAQAVRNRKTYLNELVSGHIEAAAGARVNVLNIASGPGRDVFELLSSAPGDISFDCIDQDAKAVAHASTLCADFARQISFRKTSVLRYRPDKLYDVIWAAGLFDYFSDRVFTIVLRRLMPFVKPGGEVVIGNFCINGSHPNFQWLRFCEWILHHRSADRLKELAIEAGADASRISVGREAAGVNLFLHVASE